MTLILTQTHIEHMECHVAQAYPQEGCGLLVGRLDPKTQIKTVVRVAALNNAWATDVAADLAEQGYGDSAQFTATRRYWIDSKDLLTTQREARADGLTIIGTYHSHPEAEAIPSECDRTLAWSTYSYIIISVRNGTAVDLQNWQLDNNHQFQPEPMKITPASAARDRMPLLSS